MSRFTNEPLYQEGEEAVHYLIEPLSDTDGQVIAYTSFDREIRVKVELQPTDPDGKRFAGISCKIVTETEPGEQEVVDGGYYRYEIPPSERYPLVYALNRAVNWAAGA